MLSSIEALSSIQHIPIGSDISYNGSKYTLKYFYVLASHHMTSQRGCLVGGRDLAALSVLCDRWWVVFLDEGGKSFY